MKNTVQDNFEIKSILGEIPTASSPHMDLFKKTFDFHEDYRAEKLISLMDIFHEMILMVSSDMKILFANAEARNRDCFEKYQEKRIEDILNLTEDSKKQITTNANNFKTFLSFEAILSDVFSSPVRCEVSYFPLTNGQIISFWILHDLTNYKKIENSFLETERKYRKILKETNDAVCIVNQRMIIQEINLAGQALLRFQMKNESRPSFENFISEFDSQFFKKIISDNKKANNYKLILHISDEFNPMVLVNFQPLGNSGEYIVFMKDVSDELLFHQLMLRTIVNTQEKERERLARDIHDDLGQQLSALKFNLSALRSYVKGDQAKELLVESENILLDASSSVRSICFDLMPKSLKKNGLHEAILELIRKSEAMNHVEIKLNCDDSFPVLSNELNVSIYRILQEFLNNSIRHGKASEITLRFLVALNGIRIILSDNGKGFDVTKSDFKKGNGLDNIETRVKSYNGTIEIISVPNEGTRHEIIIPNINL